MSTDLFNGLIVPLLPDFDGAKVSYTVRELDQACEAGKLYAIDVIGDSQIRAKPCNPHNPSIDWERVNQVQILFNHVGEEIHLELENGKVVKGYHEYPSGKVVDWEYSK